MADNIKFGSQAYTWYMSYNKYFGKVPHMLNVISKSEFEGLEIMTRFLGEYADSAKLSAAVEESGVALAALALTLPWLNEKETEVERQNTDLVMDLLKGFPGTLLMLGHKPVGNREDLYARQKRQIGVINEVAKRASGKGLKVAYHANSPAGSLFRTEEDYRILADLLDERVIGLALDAGHMANGNCDVPALFKEFMSKIKHVHYKDMTESHEWTPMGKGIIDFVAISGLLRSNGYSGWIIVEDESPEALVDPDQVTIDNGKYIAEFLRQR